MRPRAGALRPEPVVVGMADGMFAMTVARTVSGDTPRLADAQPAIDRRDTTATAPTRAVEGVIMANHERRFGAEQSTAEKPLPRNLLAERRRELEEARRPTIKTG